jgi:tetratricopeptide (TPR) repeat protein
LYAWVGDAERDVGNYPTAIDTRRRGIAVLERLYASTGDVDLQWRLIAALRTLGVYYSERGESSLAAEQFRAAVNQATALIPKEPSNTLWLEYAAWARLGLARELLQSGSKEEAAASTAAACASFQSLLKRDGLKPVWRSGLAECWSMQSRISLAAGAREAARKQAQMAVDVSKTIRTNDTIADRRRLAGAFRLLGDIERQSGDAAAAQAAWGNALGALPNGMTERPDEMAERAAILERLSRSAEAQPLKARLSSMGYHAPA